MATYYVGLGGNDGNTGLSWAQRFLTLNGAEDEPVAASDTVYVAPGVYRELLTCDVSGTNGNPITYIADVTGENTDGVGGIVRITGSDDDTTLTRANCITANSIDYRTFRGFFFNLVTVDGNFILAQNCDYWIIEDCCLFEMNGSHIYVSGTSTNLTIRRCLFFGAFYSKSIIELQSGTTTNASHLIENCMFVMGIGRGIDIDDVGGVTFKNCTFEGGRAGVEITDALPAEHTVVTVNNCIFSGCQVALESVNVGELVENYNTFWNCNTDRINVNTGANSEVFPPLYNPPILLDGYIFPWQIGELSEVSAVRAITGASEAADDLFGQTRPVTAAKKSWGAVQFDDISRSSTQADAGTYSAKLADAGRMQLKVPVTAVSTTISCEVYREADYAGTAPQMIIKQPGQSDDTTTDAGAAETFNTLTTTLTPAALPPYVIIELVSNNTAVADDYNIYFDTLAVS